MQFDEDMSNVIQTTAKADTGSRLQAMTTIIVSYASERFGLIEKGNPKTYTVNHELHHALQTFKKQFKSFWEGQATISWAA